MDPLDGQMKLHIFLKSFEGSHFEQALQRINNHPISDATACLLGIKKSNKCKVNSIKASSSQSLGRNQLTPIISKHYVSSRHGVDDALDLYFKRHQNGQSMATNIKFEEKRTEIIVCERCAGQHHIDNCDETDYVCHMCGGAHHRMFECQRAKCYLCFELGHLSNQCPLKKAL